MRWPDWLLLVAAACLIAIGPAMALQEIAKASDEDARGQRGAPTPPDLSFRALWRLPLAGLVVLVGILGTTRAVRALVDTGVRSVARRLLVLLLSGLALLYAAYFVDGAVFATTPFLVRGSTIVWAYPLAGILIGGSTHRLAELEEHFARGRADDLEFRI